MTGPGLVDCCNELIFEIKLSDPHGKTSQWAGITWKMSWMWQTVQNDWRCQATPRTSASGNLNILSIIETTSNLILFLNVMASGRLCSLFYITTHNPIIVLYWTQLLEYWSHDINFMLWSIVTRLMRASQYSLRTILWKYNVVRLICLKKADVYYYTFRGSGWHGGYHTTVSVNRPSGIWTTWVESCNLWGKRSTPKPPRLDSSNLIHIFFRILKAVDRYQI